MKKSKQQEIKETENYIAFLEKAVASKNFPRLNPVLYEETKEKLKKARFRLKCLKT